jgi:fructose-specific phosphotransferase system IIB component
MRIVAVTACPTGVAHTYMAAERLEKAARRLGHLIKVETQGSMGIENELTVEEIERADVVIFAAEVAVRNRERFEGRRIVEVGIQAAIKDPDRILAGLGG